MDMIGILPEYQGIAKHDYWKSYFKYLCGHILCNMYHLRELSAIIKNDMMKVQQKISGGFRT
jgi:transposase